MSEQSKLDLGGAKHRCGRREDYVAGQLSPFLPPMGDGGDEFPDVYRPRDGGMVCSYCGSISGDELMAHLEAGDVELGPTDKSYKVYVEGLGRFTKFYFQHLSVEQRQRFVELLNAKKLRIGYPGHFYSLPFFIRS